MDEEQRKARAEKIRRNKAMDAANGVRRQWIQDRLLTSGTRLPAVAWRSRLPLYLFPVLRWTHMRVSSTALEKGRERLACDLPGVQAAVPRLLAATARDDDLDGYCLASPEGSPQWLLGIHRTPRLRLVAQTYGDPRNRSVRGLLAGLRLGLLPDADDDGRDVDTWVDHAYWNEFWREKMSQDETGWQEFVDRVCAALEVDPGRVDMHGVLDLSREVAHAGARPMAPVSAHLWGLAAGADPGADLDYLRRVVEDSATSAPLPPLKAEEK